MPPSLSKLLLVPLVNGDENGHAQSRVCRAILELSLHFSALAFGLAYLCPPAWDCDAFRSLVNIAMFVRGSH